ncbi:Shedu anti-phage system protein SduA domain-containing protein [Peribacillus frigoritolerans]|uniref:Shedu anti-phage system protein SduA domain-containing protein n=2 Tax=Peribacillus TaxID=2675229 RepID=UPI003DA64D20
MKKEMMVKGRVLGYLTEVFVKEFVESILNYNESYRKIGVDITPFLPKPFRDKRKLVANITYLTKVDCLVIQFVIGDRSGINYWVEESDIYLEAAIEKNEDRLKIEGNFSQALYPENLNQIFDPVAFAIYFSVDVFNKRSKNPAGLAEEVIRANLNYHNNFLQANLISDKINKATYISRLKSISDEFFTLINNLDTPELVIDKFLEDNPIILKEGLRIDKLIHQSDLENVLSKYAHNLKPDLIAYDVSEKRWVIVDYKKANKKLLKNVERTRVGLTSEVHSLRDQLFDYMEFFEEHKHRKSFEKKFKVKIVNPSCIGIIGKLEAELQEPFNRLLKNEPRWFKVIPYNYLYDNFNNFISSGEKFITE